MFQTSVFRKYIRSIDQIAVDAAWARFEAMFLNEEKQQNIRNSIEIQYQEGFCRDLFCHVLGYTINPDPGFNLKTEQKNQNASSKFDNRSADAAIILNGNVRVVIELKGCDTLDLSKVENQAFGYKAHQPGCRYVVISNFERLRFYIDTADKYLEFNLFALTKEEFTKLYLCLALTQIENDVPAHIKAESLTSETEITASFYKDYSAFKRNLFNNIVEHNADQFDKLLLFRKTQKLLDRLIFILFCEDRGLLVANTVAKIIKRWGDLKRLDAYQPLYNLFKRHFSYIDAGHKDDEITVFGYNGGLFHTDEVLDALVIDDEILLGTQKLSDYDFESDVSVDILGHIFEHSLTEIEEIQNQIIAETATDGIKAETKKTSKRKKDGVFYTPAYITKYIVENTIGRLCDEKKKELGIDDETYAERNKKNTKKEQNTKKQLTETLDQYRNWLLGLKICDPACGSGAFLNAALQFLQNEHHLIDIYKAHIYGHSLIFSDVDSAILENNLYGVDINEESVEIAKLSLWLHTAQRGRKLTTLNNNIKCGNSLIDDPAVAGDKAFNWQSEFPEVFANGGFDVVIGNPPYVRVQQIDYNIIDGLKSKYKTALKRIDISLCFIEKSKDLIKETGITCFITSNQFLTTEYGQLMRHFLLTEYFLINCIDFGDLPIFDDALTYVSIFSFSKQLQQKFDYCFIRNIDDAKQGYYNRSFEIEISQLNDSNWNLCKYEISDIFTKIVINSKLISEIGNAWYGIVSGADNIFIFTQEDYNATKIEKELFLPLMRAQNCNKFYCSKACKYILYPYKQTESNKTQLLTENELSEHYPNAYRYLIEHKNELESRKDSRSTFKDRPDWYCLTRFGQLDIFKRDKILTPGEVKSQCFCMDYSYSGYSGARVFGIVIDNDIFNIKYVLSILNSNLMRCYLQSFASLKAGGYYSYSSNILNRVPIKVATSEQQAPLIALADAQLAANEQLQKFVTKFLNRAQTSLGLTKVTEKLESFYKLDFKGFTGELKKQKIKLSLRDQDEWEEYFNSYREDCTRLLLEIEENDRKIDQLVYALYGLTEEEIAVVEGN